MGLIKKIFSALNKIWIIPNLSYSQLKGSVLFLVRVVVEKNNSVNLRNSILEKVTIRISGNGNIFSCENAFIQNSNISIKGENNTITVHDSAKLRKTEIIIRGTNCQLIIGQKTTFGGIRIVNVGDTNLIEIGKNCLFSDNIEIWASDTHSIFNELGDLINGEKPIRIGDNVWVGSRVIILKGVTISKGSVIGMGSVITKDVPANVISGGYPNQTIRENINWSLKYHTDN